MKVVLALLLLCVFSYAQNQVPSNANVLLVDENSDVNDQNNIIGACTSCTFTVVEAPLDAAVSPFDNEIDLAFDMVVYLKSDDDWDGFTPRSETWRTNLENFANTGRVVLLTQYDMLASAQDDVLISLVGGSGSDDCSGWSGTIPDPFPTNVPECDLILNGGFFDLRGLTAGVDVGTLWGVNSFPSDLDCETLIPGESFACLSSVAYDPSDNVIWAVRPMDLGGSVVWMSIDDDGDLLPYQVDGSVYFYALNNMFNFAEGNAQGDPHITTLYHEQIDLNEEHIYNLYNDGVVAVNGRVGQNSFITEAGVTFKGNLVEVHCQEDGCTFALNGSPIEMGENYLNGTVSLRDYTPIIKNEEMAKHLDSTLFLFVDGRTIAIDTGIFTVADVKSFPFMNIIVKDHRRNQVSKERDVSNFGVFQVEDLTSEMERSVSPFQRFVVNSLF